MIWFLEIVHVFRLKNLRPEPVKQPKNVHLRLIFCTFHMNSFQLPSHWNYKILKLLIFALEPRSDPWFYGTQNFKKYIFWLYQNKKIWRKVFISNILDDFDISRRLPIKICIYLLSSYYKSVIKNKIPSVVRTTNSEKLIGGHQLNSVK